MQNASAGNKNAGKVMRKNTPSEERMPNAKAAQENTA
jgi:hypothetical protein